MDNNQELKNFLIYSYFGIVSQNLFDSKTKKERSDDSYHDYCVKRVIIKAYSDATNEGAYNTLFKKGLRDREKLVASSKAARRKSAKFLLEKIKELNTVVNFDKWHEEVCKKLVENYETVKSEKITFFTYGNAQKWVNMTIKYLWMLGMLPSNINANDLHIPIDSFIIDALWKDQDIIFPLIDEKTTTRSFAYKKPSDKVKGWSTWKDYKVYEDFRKSVKGIDYTLAWENEAWIEKAEERKKKERLEQHNVFFGKNDVKEDT